MWVTKMGCQQADCKYSDHCLRPKLGSMNIQRRRKNSICVHIEFRQKGHQLTKCNSQKN